MEKEEEDGRGGGDSQRWPSCILCILLAADAAAW